MGAPGFDDAPLVNPVQNDHPTAITLIYPYYRNPQFLQKQIQHWHRYASELKAYVSAIIIDDGSPEPAAMTLRCIPQPFPLRLFRIEVDVRWNWLAARNIGMHHASGWCVLTDMDHVVPQETVAALVYGKHDEAVIYRFSRREADGRAIHPHPNSMFMTREMFWQVGGYDEALSGHYGTDGDWRRRCAATTNIRTLPYKLERHEYEGDSSTTNYLRKQPQDAGKKAIIAKRAKGWRPRTLSFPYHEVML